MSSIIAPSAKSDGVTVSERLKLDASYYSSTKNQIGIKSISSNLKRHMFFGRWEVYIHS